MDIYIGSLQYFEEKDRLKGEFLTRRAQVLGEDDESNFSNLGLTGTTKTTFGSNTIGTGYVAPTLNFADTRTAEEKAAASAATAKEFEEKSTSIWGSILNDPTWKKQKEELLNMQATNAKQYADMQAAQTQQQAAAQNQEFAAPVEVPKDNTMLYVGGGVVLLAVGGLIYALTSGGGGSAETTLA